MNWPSIWAHKPFWIYDLRLFQNFDGDRVASGGFNRWHAR